VDSHDVQLPVLLVGDRHLHHWVMACVSYFLTSLTQAGETCVCSVPDEYIDTYGAKEILEKSGVWDNIGDQLSDKDDTVILKVFMTHQLMRV
jgi:hypothetical protein